MLILLLASPMLCAGEVAFKLSLSTGGREEVREVQRIALSLPKGNAVSAKWEGHIVTARRGEVVFTAKVRGVFKVTINGRLLLEGAGDSIAQSMDKGVMLEAGANQLVAEFHSDGTEDAVVELDWKPR
ncbi:MAG: hypothetical protein ABMA13_10125 [Chthoniobacteraceae bacterium]